MALAKVYEGLACARCLLRECDARARDASPAKCLFGTVNEKREREQKS